jgi:hypothetical protein
VALKVGGVKSLAGAERGDGLNRLTWRDGLSYGLAWFAWLALAAAFAAALQAVRSTIGPLALAVLLQNASEPRHFFNLGGQAFVADRIALVVLGLLWLVYLFLAEEYLRASVGAARALRLRAISADGCAPTATRGWMRQHGLVELARRTAIAAAFPAGAAIFYGLLLGLLWVITH